ncbi:MAG: NAD-dependent epimerase/dehydratase family protein [Candidatus Sulfobium sp.]
MKALVTGATGFIGSYLAEALLRRGYEVTCIARSTSDLKWIEHLDLKYISCDLADIDSCAGQIKDFDFIFHLAGLTKAKTESEFFSANAVCTAKLAKIAAERNVGLRRFVYVSSLAAAGPSSDGVPLKEDCEPMPVSFYGKSKLEGEKAVLRHCGEMPVTVIRPSAVYGPRDADFLVMFRMVKRGIFPYLSDEMVYTNGEIIKGISEALETKPIKIRLPLPLVPFFAFLGEKINKKSIINSDKVRELRFSNWTCDVGKARRELGFGSKTTLTEGVKWTADWYKIHRWL